MSFPLTGGECLSVMSPGIRHQEVQTDLFQSYVAIVIDATLFEKTLSQYMDELPVFKGEAYIPSPELTGLIRTFMIEAREYESYGLLDKIAELIAHVTARSVMSTTAKQKNVSRSSLYMNGWR